MIGAVFDRLEDNHLSTGATPQIRGSVSVLLVNLFCCALSSPAVNGNVVSLCLTHPSGWRLTLFVSQSKALALFPICLVEYSFVMEGFISNSNKLGKLLHQKWRGLCSRTK